MRRKMGLTTLSNKLDDDYVKGVQQAGNEAGNAAREGLMMQKLSKKIQKKKRKEEKKAGENAKTKPKWSVKELILGSESDDNE